MTTFSAEDYAKMYIKEIVRLHGVPVSIISDIGAQFTANFWRSFQKGLGIRINLSTSFHSQTDVQASSTIQMLEDMLHACVLGFKGNWEDNLPLITTAIIKWYHMRPYMDKNADLLSTGSKWVKQCYWGPELVQHVVETVSPMKGMVRFGKKGKLSRQFIGPYQIIHKVGQVYYELELPTKLGEVHPVFYVSMLRKCLSGPSYITHVEDIHVTEDLSYEEVPMVILDRQIRNLQTIEVALVKVLWRNRDRE
nr:uncharacterized protein LOC104111376 [Nicotiana tomentosiformis]